MSIENTLNDLKKELEALELPSNTDINRLFDTNITGNVSPLITHLAAAIVTELRATDSPMSDFIIELLSGFLPESPSGKGKAPTKPKTTSSEDVLENARQTYEWLSTTMPFEQILNIVKAATYFVAIAFGEFGVIREKSSQEANRLNRPTLLESNLLAAQYYRQPEHQKPIKEKLTLYGYSDQDIDSLLLMSKNYPSISDLVMFSVREAYNQVAINKFGLAEDMPQQFIDEAKLMGMDEKDAKKYWYSHWNLPSAQQAFEMLHRGEIDESELDLILKANDFMPAYREKLKNIAYNTLTRVDIRRLYQEKVLSEEEVYEEHLRVGYNPTDAERLTQFTVQEFQQEDREFTMSQILSLYEDKIFSRNEALDSLNKLGYPSADAETLVLRKELDIEEKRTKRVLNRLRTSFVNGGEDIDSVKRQLNVIGIEYQQQQELISEWELDKEAASKKFTTAEIKSMFGNDIINRAEAYNELLTQNWSDKRASMLLDLWQAQAGKKK